MLMKSYRISFICEALSVGFYFYFFYYFNCTGEGDFCSFCEFTEGDVGILGTVGTVGTEGTEAWALVPGPNEWKTTLGICSLGLSMGLSLVYPDIPNECNLSTVVGTSRDSLALLLISALSKCSTSLGFNKFWLYSVCVFCGGSCFRTVSLPCYPVCC